MLLKSHSAGELLSEKELDQLVACKDDELTPPFQASMQVPSQSSIAASPSLGRRDRGVPEALHSQMEAMVAAGTLHPTTPEQRQRNRGTAGSEYGVPAGLGDALKYGYIGPNLPPPAGLTWRHSGGQWKLIPRGG